MDPWVWRSPVAGNFPPSDVAASVLRPTVGKGKLEKGTSANSPAVVTSYWKAASIDEASPASPVLSSMRPWPDSAPDPKPTKSHNGPRERGARAP
ncbi:hypothetical protein VTN00DRAFT_5328 [Thermoascus crustaceus]|uniref:uncharacterized protein n=1 Tax=Thermoascus crustaceus TaxID=5088 RepID=UPI003743EA33